MYTTFFGLKREPFSIAPDPRYLFMSERHREALAHLLYGVRGGGGFVLLTGDIGAGKTTVCRCFLEQIPKRCNVAYIFNPKLTVLELLQSVCEEFRIPLEATATAATVKDYLDPLNNFLLKTHAVGQNNLLIIDEAQNLSADVLEQLRLLTNLETSQRKLLQIVLIGQPELRDMLARPELEQLAQRVIARYHLEALTQAETAHYMAHRLTVAGLSRPMPFDAASQKRVFELARGVPRRINLLCDRALLGAYSQSKEQVDVATVEAAAQEVFGNPALRVKSQGRLSHWVAGAWGVAAGAALFAGVGWVLNGGLQQGASAVRVQPVAPASAAVARAASVALPASVPASAPAPLAIPSEPALLVAADLRTGPGVALVTTENEAWRELAMAWQLSPGRAEPCAAAPRQQVQCFKGAADLALIRQLGRPGMLTLKDEGGQVAYAVLTGLTDKTATLRMGSFSGTLPLMELARLWQGEFATLWRTPQGYTTPLGKGQSGEVVAQLATQLATLQGELTPQGPQVFNAALQSKVMAFQRAQGLAADGVAGPTTFMQLNRASGVSEPRLQTQ
jgi:general secretion pathway protein A